MGGRFRLRALAGRVVWPKEKPAGVNRQSYGDPAPPPARPTALPGRKIVD
jgi:hypothetical protein